MNYLMRDTALIDSSRMTTPLHAAARLDNREFIERLLDAGADINCLDEEGNTPLAVAVGLDRGEQNINLDKTLFWVSQGANPSSRNDAGQSVWWASGAAAQNLMVAEMENLDAQISMLQTASVRTYRMNADLSENEAAERPLMQKEKNTAMALQISVSASKGDLIEVERLISAGADPSYAYENQYTLLHEASELGQLELAKILITAGADVHARCFEGGTPLHVAARFGRIDICRLLLAHDADANAINDYGCPPLISAIRGHAVCEDRLTNRINICELLIAAGADPNPITGLHKLSPLLFAINADVCDHDLVRLLVTKGAELNEVDESPLALAIQIYNSAQAEVENSTPASLQHSEIEMDAAWETVSLLVELGANLDKVFFEADRGEDEGMKVSAADRLTDETVVKLRAVQDKSVLDQNTMAASSLFLRTHQCAASSRDLLVGDEDPSPMRVPSPDPGPRARSVDQSGAEVLTEYDQNPSAVRRL